MNLQALQEKRAAAIAIARGITEKMDKEDRTALTEEEAKDFKKAETEARSLNDAIERQQFLDEQERSQPTVRRGNDGDFDSQCRSFQITTAIANFLKPGSVDAGRETEISQELARRDGKKARGILVPHQPLFEKRALLTTSGGAALYPERHRDDLYIDRLRESLRVAQLGATVLSGLSGTQDIPRLATSTSASWSGEHQDVTPSDVAFDNVSMSPKTVGAETEFSRRMIINANPSIEQLLRNDLASVLATAIDYEAINGDGTANKPTGILNTAGVNTMPFTAGVNWAELLKITEMLTEDRALMGSLAWLVNPTFVRYARTGVKTPSTEKFIMEGTSELADYPLQQTNHMPKDTGADGDEMPVIFGNWNDLLIGYWSSVDILVNPYHQEVYSKGGVKINALQDVDIAVRHPESFVIGTGLKA